MAEHISHPEDLVLFNQHILLHSDTVVPISKIIKMESIDVESINKYQSSNGNILFKILFAHNYMDNYVYMLDNINYPYIFDWVQEILNTPIIVAIHIRRGDVSQKKNRTRYVSISYYLDCINLLSHMLTQNQIKHEIHVYTESTVEKEIFSHKNLFLHIDSNVVETFVSFVNADILFTGFSSFSYTPIFLRKKGCVLYTPFWHKFPKQAIKIHEPHDIISEQKKIITKLIFSHKVT